MDGHDRVPLDLSVPVSKLMDDNGTKYTAYEVVVSTAMGKTWSVSHRYSEFAALYGQLNAVLPLPVALPPKKMWGNFNVDVVEARRAGFDAFLKAAVKEHMQHGELAPLINTFIGADEHLPQIDAKEAGADGHAAADEGEHARAEPMSEKEWEQSVLDGMRDDLIDVSELPMALEGPDADERIEMYQDVCFQSLIVDDTSTFAVPASRGLSAAELEALLLDDHLRSCKQTVAAWLRSTDLASGGKVIWVGADAVHVTASRADVERVFGVALRAYRRDVDGAVAFRAAEPSALLQLPAAVQRCVDVASGLQASELSAIPRDVSSTTLAPPERRPTVTPAVLARMYGLPSTVENTGGKSRQATANFIGQYYAKSDLDIFFAEYDHSLVGVYPPNVGPGNATGAPGSEASLDLQYIMSTATVSVPTEFWSAPPHEALFPWAQRLNAAADPPQVHSVSYGGDEAGLNHSYATRFNVELQKAGVRGMSIIVAAGDDGVGCGEQFSPTHTEAYAPNFPASFPAVTTVGGTDFAGPMHQPNAEHTETTWSQGGGGFSNAFLRPSYQEEAVSSFLKDNAGSLPLAKMFNAGGRAYPDVSAMATGYAVEQARKLTVAAGTSASTPVFAGVVARLNAARLMHGKPALGFLNPWLYQIAGTGFKDITTGSNPGGGKRYEHCKDDIGFQASKGWDPATGWGTPDFKALLAAALAA